MYIFGTRGLEKAKSNRAVCWGCDKLIGKGTPRIPIETKLAPQVWIRFLCYECSDKRLDEDILHLKNTITHTKRQKTKLKRMIVKSSKEIILSQLNDDNKNG